jgi:large subunit ribosomal protein L7Ae
MAKGAVKKGGAKKDKRLARKKNPLFEKRPHNLRIGNDIQPKRDLTRLLRWPKYVLLQRQKRVLLARLKVPGQLNQFSYALERNQTKSLFNLLKKYEPETRKDKKARLTEAAKNKTDGKSTETKKPLKLQYGLNNVTTLIEAKKAKLVVIANDVDPIELVLWLPTLCRKMDIPYCFVRNQARLGALVHLKTATCVAITEVRPEDRATFEQLTKNFRSSYNDNEDIRRKQSVQTFGIKSNHAAEKIQKAKELEELKKAKL